MLQLRTSNKKMLLLSLLLILPFTVFAANSDTIAVIYNGNTKVNRETYMFFSKTQRQLGYNYRYQAFSTNQNPGDGYAGYIVLSTGITTGIEPEIEDFLERNNQLKNVVLVSLLANSTDYEIYYTASDENNAGVDAITAASAWPGHGSGGLGRRFSLFGNSDNESSSESFNLVQMHTEWFEKVLEIINQ